MPSQWPKLHPRHGQRRCSNLHLIWAEHRPPGEVADLCGCHEGRFGDVQAGTDDLVERQCFNKLEHLVDSPGARATQTESLADARVFGVQHHLERMCYVQAVHRA